MTTHNEIVLMPIKRRYLHLAIWFVWFASYLTSVSGHTLFNETQLDLFAGVGFHISAQKMLSNVYLAPFYLPYVEHMALNFIYLLICLVFMLLLIARRILVSKGMIENTDIESRTVFWVNVSILIVISFCILHNDFLIFYQATARASLGVYPYGLLSVSIMTPLLLLFCIEAFVAPKILENLNVMANDDG